MKDQSIAHPTSFKVRLVAEIAFLKVKAKHFALAPDDLNDLVQSTLLKALNCSSNFRSDTNLRGWLYILMRNIYINSNRKQCRLNKFTEIALINGSFCAPKHENLNDGEGRLILNDVQIAIEKLQQTESKTFELFVCGYKYHEIARELKVPIGTVKTRIFIARNKLKNMLTDYHPLGQPT
ncbi:sigma-70 family RNA polymerase sigma factor [Sphingobacterium faecium]|uniref:sigma-70 family RNA polymerase sigma factor n=1 Tax=Sphingobacterium faecium TaxID=34087 RepID=UPI00320B53C8